MDSLTTTSQADPLVRIRDLRYRYPEHEKDVLRISSLDIRGSGLIALTGLSGAGKTTLVELIAGTLRGPYEGSLEVLGREWQELRRDADRQRHLRRIGLIPQDYGLLPTLTPRQTLLQDLTDAEVPAHERSERGERSLSEVKLDGLADRPIAQLSGGQRQRVAIARMLARDVELVIADEPTANLDRELVEETITLLRKIAAHAPVLIVTHDPHVAALCDRTIVLQGLADVVSTAAPIPTRSRPRRASLVIVSAIAGLLILLAAAIVLATNHSPAKRAMSQVAGVPHRKQAPSYHKQAPSKSEVGTGPSDAEVRTELEQMQASESTAKEHQLTAVPGGKSIGGNGTIPIPADVPEVVQKVIAGANEIADFPYMLNGGHRSFVDDAYDSSGSVGYALAAGGLLATPETSSQLESWGVAGPGRYITVYTNASHTYMYVNGILYDTAGRSGRYASRWQVGTLDNAGYIARHWPGL
jgi:ABC-type lipoprotein export system ATPase subunit